jgi:hypothetical protein
MKLLLEMIEKIKEAYNVEMMRYNNTTVTISSRDDISSIYSLQEHGLILSRVHLDTAFMLLNNLDSYMRYQSELENLFASMSKNSSEVQSHNFIHNRSKREILGAIGLAVSVSNSIRISSMEQALESLSSNHNSIVDAVGLLNKKHEQLAFDVGLIMRLIKVLEVNARKVMSSATVLMDRLRGTVDDLVAIATEGQRRRVSIRLINGEALEELFRAMKLRAKLQGLEMVLEKATDIYSIESSYAYEPGTYMFNVYLHFPFLHPSDRLGLYEYLPHPLIESLKRNVSILPSPQGTKYLGILPDSARTSIDPRHKFRLLTESDIQSCTRFRKFFFCPKRNTLRIDWQSECLVSLWLQDHKRVIKHCKMELSPMREHVTKISSDTWAIMSPNQKHFPVVCGKRSLKPVTLRNQSILTLPQGCRVETERFVLSTDDHQYAEFKVERASWAEDISVFDGIFNDDDDLDKVLNELTSRRDEFGIPDVSSQKFYYQAPPDLISGLWNSIKGLSIFSGISNIFSLAIYILIGWVIYLVVSSEWFKALFKSEPEPRVITFERPLRSSLRRNPSRRARYRPESAIVDIEDSDSQPPPYASLSLDKKKSVIEKDMEVN